MRFESLPVELIADILGELDLEHLIKVSYLSRRLYAVAADPSLNPWRRPILRNLRSRSYESALKTLSVRLVVPRQNWIEILSLAPKEFLLFQATLPNLKAADWEECFNRRFLPGWRRWKADGTWKEAFMKILHRLWHRSITSCTSDESWTKYIVLNRNGSANELESASRTFNPVAVFDEMKLQSDLAHLETRVRLVLQLADARVLAFGVLNRPRSPLTVNPNADVFLHPPGIEVNETGLSRDSTLPALRPNLIPDHGVYPLGMRSASHGPNAYQTPPPDYDRLSHPLPALSHANYPFYTPGGGDSRWFVSGGVEENGLQWVGGLMIVAQILEPNAHETLLVQEADLIAVSQRGHFAAFTWADLFSIAPWLHERITVQIDGPGLGI